MSKIISGWSKPALILFAILLFAAAIRLWLLNSFPIFADEAIYVRWAQVMKAEPSLRFLPLSDGKQPLFMWAVIPFLKVIADPLIAGRLVSVFTGLGSIIGIFVLSYLIFSSKRVSVISSLIYAISPFSIFYDRMALVDSMLAFWGVWLLIFSILAIRLKRIDAAMVAGFCLGAALLTKSPGLFFALLLPSTVLLTNWPKTKKKLKVFILQLLGLYSVIWAIGYGIYNVLRLGPNFNMVASRNLDYVYPISHLFENPLDPLLPYLDRAIQWIELLGPSLLIVFVLLGGIKNLKLNFKEILFLLIWTIIPVVVQAEFAKVFTTRYILFALPTLFILAASTFLNLKNKNFKIAAFLVGAIYIVHSLTITYGIYTDPVNSNLPPNEKSGFLEEWSSGTGIRQASGIIRNIYNQKPQPIVIGTEGYFGTLPDGMQLYLNDLSEITVIGLGLHIDHIPDQLVASKDFGNRTFLAANSSRLDFPEELTGKYDLKIVYSVEKAKRREGTHEYHGSGPQDTFYLFELVEKENGK